MTPQEILDSNLRWRRNFAALAIVVPAVLFALFARNQRKLDALADHGVPAVATVTGITQDGQTTRYSYVVDGNGYSWSAHHDEAAHHVDETFPITVLPEDPSFNRPGNPYSTTTRARDRAPGVVYGAPLGAFAFFALAALLCHRAIVRDRRGIASRAAPVSPKKMGLVVAAILWILPIVSLGLDAKSAALTAKLFGTGPAVVPLVMLTVAVLGTPVFLLGPAVMELTIRHRERGGSLSRLGVILAVVRAEQEDWKAQWIAFGTSFYFLVLLAAWIAYTAWKGV